MKLLIRVKGLGLELRDLGIRAWGLGFRVWGLGFFKGWGFGVKGVWVAWMTWKGLHMMNVLLIQPSENMYPLK